MGEIGDWGRLSLFGTDIYAIDDIMLSPIGGTAEFTFTKITKGENKSRKPQIFVNGDVTTLKVDGKVYHSRPEKGEKFDLEKGILVCLAKSYGWSTTDILKLKENAKIHRKVEKKANNKKK